jgi:hypothetical protein
MKAFIDEHRAVYGVEPISRVLPIAPSTYYAHAHRQANPERRSLRAQHDEVLSGHIQRIWEENSRSTASAKSGGNSSVKAWELPAARWND